MTSLPLSYDYYCIERYRGHFDSERILLSRRSDAAFPDKDAFRSDFTHTKCHKAHLTLSSMANGMIHWGISAYIIYDLQGNAK